MEINNRDRLIAAREDIRPYLRNPEEAHSLATAFVEKYHGVTFSEEFPYWLAIDFFVGDLPAEVAYHNPT